MHSQILRRRTENLLENWLKHNLLFWHLRYLKLFPFFFFFLQRELLITKALWKKGNILIKNVPKVGIKIQGLLYFILDSMWPQLTSHVVSIGKEYACKAGDTREAVSIPGSGRFHGEGNGNPLQYSCLGKLKDRGAWQTTVHEVTKSQAWLSS